MSILKPKIYGHDKKIPQNIPSPQTKTCNCMKKENCPVKGQIKH